MLLCNPSRKDESRLLQSVVSWAPQREAFWTISGSIFFFSPSKEGYVQYFPQKKKEGESTVDIILLMRSSLEEALLALSQEDSRLLWHKVSWNGLIEVWEKIPESYKGVKLPFRFGVSTEIMSQMGSLARKVILTSLVDKKSARDTGGIENGHNTRNHCMSVTLWNEGEVRGSAIRRGKTKEEALVLASLSALYDMRCNPLRLDEVDTVTIEIGSIDTLLIPLTEEERKRNEILEGMAYAFSSQKNRISWIIPSLLLTTQASSLSQFLALRFLYQEKPLENLSSKSDESFYHARIFSWTSDSFTEKEFRDKDVSSEKEDSLVAVMLSFLEKKQEADGFIPTQYDVILNKKKAINWTLLTLTTSALACYGHEYKDDRALSIARRAYEYQKEILPHLDSNDAVLYLAVTARFFNDIVTVEKCDSFLEKNYMKSLPQPLFTLSYVLYVLENKILNILSEESIVTLVENIYTSWCSDTSTKKTYQLSLYADLMPALQFLGKKKKDGALLKKAQEVFSFYREQQREDGSFPSFFGSTSSYVRGTAKILESMSRAGFLKQGENVSYLKGFKYIAKMQYTEESLFFLSESYRKEYRGSFRHDAHDTTVWIDACGHILYMLSFSIS